MSFDESLYDRITSTTGVAWRSEIAGATWRVYVFYMTECVYEGEPEGEPESFVSDVIYEELRGGYWSRTGHPPCNEAREAAHALESMLEGMDASCGVPIPTANTREHPEDADVTIRIVWKRYDGR